MNKANLERLEMLLKGHAEMVEEKRVRPEGVLRHNDAFRERFNQVSRSVIMPVLEEIKNVMVGKVESASIFHRSTTAGLKVKLDRWEDYDRSLLFFGDDSTKVVKITHEGIGFGLLTEKIPLSQLTPELVEAEAMKFLKRLFGQEQLRRPAALPGAAAAGQRPAGSTAAHYGYELVRV
jgi:hypothetical protein